MYEAILTNLCSCLMNTFGPPSAKLVAARSEPRKRPACTHMGPPSTMNYSMYLTDRGTIISPWHDIPLWNEDGTANFVCEIPKETMPKMEMNTKEKRNPIKQDIIRGELRFYPYNIHWNYGFLPRTWEDPEYLHPALQARGDNDPVDVVGLGERAVRGGVYKVKPVGALAMIDEGELDWKLIAINADDPKAVYVNDVEDIEREFPGELERIRIWFRDYKIPDGKPEGKFGFNDKVQNKEVTHAVIEETHSFWRRLKSGERENADEFALY
eukprot:jgi/Botrbrau1/3011/Bobra.0070s0009.1